MSGDQVHAAGFGLFFQKVWVSAPEPLYQEEGTGPGDLQVTIAPKLWNILSRIADKSTQL